MLTTIITTLCIAAIFAALKSRWLYVIAPHLYLNTPLSNGQIISLIITNVGLLSEEDVALNMRPGCRFELIATSKSTLVINGNTLLIPKLSRAESVTVLLLIEGRLFDKSDIDSIESKATKGQVVESKENATTLWATIAVIPIVLAVLAVPFQFGTYIGSEMGVSALEYINEQFEVFGESKQVTGYKNTLTEKYPILAGTLAGAIRNRRLGIELQEIVRRGDVLIVSIKVANNSKQVILAEASLASVSGFIGLDRNDTMADSFALAPAESKVLRLKAYVPELASAKIVQGRYKFKIPGGDELTVDQIITF